MVKVLIAGAGLGGLTAALALHRAGCRVEICEQADELGEVGAGIQISPNAVKVLRALGLEAAFEAVAVRPTVREGRDWASGAVLQSFALDDGFAARYGAGYYHVHRADLHGLLVDAVRDLGDVPIRLGARAVGLGEADGAIRLDLADGGQATGEVLVGADGIHSAVREALFGPDHPRFTGTVAFRATVPVDRLPADMIEAKGYNWMGPHHHFVIYLLRGGQLVNCVGVCEMPDWRIESWTQRGDLDEFRREFDGWHPTIQTLINGVEACWKWALYDRDPLARWSVGRATVLGDAAHPMLPFLAQGACMAIEDGYVLARCLQRQDDPVAALAEYEAARRPRASQVQLGARARTRTLHMADADEVRQRNEANRQDPERFAKEMHWLYAYDPVAEQGPL
ncbi:MAG: FAD-dependent monooxygenase [Alphaproteobacteria bacterium]|jgi:salicylate hydroxylase|nr:FAD-dependent monooxygenase [Alphaproteobacteria bacterium]MDP6566969.1 FAD-dependent monooxygenase [Alphaproteobacteria bacterium]MDP6816024.1 FAD-dependent monooxygenase [Alphaproteobacteria bacterium]